MEKIIGFDIDGVLTDDSNIWREKLSEYTGKELEIEKKSYNFAEAFGIEEETLKEFFVEKGKEVYREVKPQKEMIKLLNKLKEDGFEIHLITARPEKEVTIEWLNKYKVPHDSINFKKKKGNLVKQKNIKLFIEDSEKNAKEIAEKNIPVVLVDKYHNQKAEKGNEHIYKLNNPNEIENFIEGFYYPVESIRELFNKF
jgi:hypothetical protein